MEDESFSSSPARSGGTSPLADPDRLAAVAATGLLDSGAEEAFDRLARLAGALLTVPYTFITIVDDSRSFWKSCIGVDTDSIEDRQIPIEESLCHAVIETDEPLVVADARQHEWTRSNPLVEKLNAVAWAGYPLRSMTGHVLGTLCVVDVNVREWSAQELYIVSTLAAAAEGEIQLRGLLREATESAAALQREMSVRGRLATLARSLSAAETTGAVAASITETGPDVLGASFANVALLDPQGRQLIVRSSMSLDPDIAAKYLSVPLIAKTPLGDAVRNGEPVLLRDHADHHPDYTHLVADAAAAGLVATAAIPLFRLDGSVVGALGVGWPRAMTFSTADLALLTTVSVMCAQAIERAQLGDLRSQLVRSLQRQLLPAIPAIAGLESAVRYIPANHELGFGGDWYDIIELGGGRAAVIVGDIAGHGIEAAARMAQVRGAINALTRIYVNDLPSIFDTAEEMLRHLDEIYIATLAIFVIDPSLGIVSYVSAGHPPAAVIHSDGSHELLEGGRRPLLGQGGQRPEIGSTGFAPGSVLIGFTDGLVEDRYTSMDSGIARMMDVVGNMAATGSDGLQPGALCDVIIEQMLGERFISDDVALIAVRRLALD